MIRESKKKPFRRYLALALAVLLTPIFAFGAAVAATGTVTVSIHERGEDGMRLYLPVPALLLDVAIFAAPRLMPEDVLADARREIAPYREQLEILAAELASCPVGVLVDVRNDGEHIRVSKSSRSFQVEVDSDETDVRITLPARLASRALDIL